MTFEQFFDAIDLKQEGRDSFYAIHTRSADPAFEAALAEAKKAFDESDEAFGEYIAEFAQRENLPVEVLNLYIYIRFSMYAYAKNQELGLTDEDFFIPARDLQGCCMILYNQTGVFGVPQKSYRLWLRHYLQNRLFRLGRLNFELRESLYDVQLGDVHVAVGDPCISVHIPGNLPFTDALCEEAYDMARAFFKKHFQMDTCVFYCGTWLLHPWLKTCMKPDSNIIKFQSKFQIVETYERENELLNIARHIFPKVCENPEDYPEDTSVQRAYKKNLLAGVPIPMGIARGYRL